MVVVVVLHLGVPSGEGVLESGEERREEEGEPRSISSTYLHGGDFVPIHLMFYLVVFMLFSK